MITIILRRDQIEELTKIEDFNHRGLAFGWDEEQLYHAFTTYPKLHPQGKAILVIFKSVMKHEEEPLAQITQILEEKHKAIRPEDPVFIILISKDKQTAYYRKGESIEDCTIKVLESGKATKTSQGQERNSVLILGLDAIGSRLALELAKSGIHQFTLLDHEEINDTNLHYHIGGVEDYGRYRTFAVRDKMLMLNPSLNINTKEKTLKNGNSIPEEQVLTEEEILDLVKSHSITLCCLPFNINRKSLSELFSNIQNKLVFFVRMMADYKGLEVFLLDTSSIHNPCFVCIMLHKKYFLRKEELILVNTTPDKFYPYKITPAVGLTTQLILEHTSNQVINNSNCFQWINDNAVGSIFEGIEDIDAHYSEKSLFRWYGERLHVHKDCPFCNEEENLKV